MRNSTLLLAILALTLTGCAFFAPNPLSEYEQDLICREWLAGRNGLDFDSVRVQNREISSDGHTIIYLQSGSYRASCEITAAGQIVHFDYLSR